MVLVLDGESIYPLWLGEWAEPPILLRAGALQSEQVFEHEVVPDSNHAIRPKTDLLHRLCLVFGVSQSVG